LTKELINSRKLANKRPALEIEESVKMYKHELQKNALNSKSIMAERNLFENKVRDLQNQIEKLNRQVRDIQNKYYEVKNRNTQKEDELKRIKDYVRNNTNNRMMFT
jgi:peptidoglycan hydrolase CwlO-like protein